MKRHITYAQYLRALSTFVTHEHGYLCCLNEGFYRSAISDRAYEKLMRARNFPHQAQLQRDIDRALDEQSERLGRSTYTLSPTVGEIGYLTEGPGIEGRRKWLLDLAERSEAQ